MKINNFQRELTDISAKKEALAAATIAIRGLPESIMYMKLSLMYTLK